MGEALIMEQTGSNLTSMAGNVAAQVVLVDDFSAFRESLMAALPAAGMQLAGQAGNGVEAVALARRLRPDVIVMDFRMPGMDGVTAARRILEDNPATAILIASLSYERPYVMRALTAGARGYLAKEDAVQALPDALHSVLAGRGYVSPSVAALVARTAPRNPLALTQEVLWAFDREAPALLRCAQQVAAASSAEEAVNAAFLSYWMALRESQVIADPQTWLLLSVAARLFRAGGQPGRWSFTRSHPGDRDLERSTPQLIAHAAGCGTCHLARMLTAFDAARQLPVDGMRDAVIHHLEVPDEAELFLNYARRQAEVMRVAGAEVRLLLGSSAETGWMRREASAGAWLSALLGGRTA